MIICSNVLVVYNYYFRKSLKKLSVSINHYLKALKKSKLAVLLSVLPFVLIIFTIYIYTFFIYIYIYIYIYILDICIYQYILIYISLYIIYIIYYIYHISVADFLFAVSLFIWIYTFLKLISSTGF